MGRYKIRYDGKFQRADGVLTDSYEVIELFENGEKFIVRADNKKRAKELMKMCIDRDKEKEDLKKNFTLTAELNRLKKAICEINESIKRGSPKLTKIVERYKEEIS